MNIKKGHKYRLKYDPNTVVVVSPFYSPWDEHIEVTVLGSQEPMRLLERSLIPFELDEEELEDEEGLEVGTLVKIKDLTNSNKKYVNDEMKINYSNKILKIKSSNINEIYKEDIEKGEYLYRLCDADWVWSRDLFTVIKDEPRWM